MSQVFIPRVYQAEMRDFMLDHPRCGVFAPMGSGKTASTLLVLDALRFFDELPALIIAPLAVAKSVWTDEAAKWDCFKDLRISRVVGEPSERKAALKKDADIYVINFENVQWLVDNLDGWPFSTVVVDESSKLRSTRASVQKAKKGGVFLRQGGSKRGSALAKASFAKTKRWINLTGTPSPNGVIDLWGQMWFLDYGKRLERTFARFTEKYFKLGFDGYSHVPLDGTFDTVKGIIHDVCLSIDMKKHLNIKEPVVTEVKAKLPDEAKRVYRRMEKEFFAQLKNHEIEAANAAVKSGKLQQLANGAAYTDDQGNWELLHDAKIEALDRVIEEACGAPVLVIYHFKSDLERLKKAFPKGETFDKSEKMIGRWNEGKIPVMFLNAASAGHGISLQHGGNIIAFFSLTWSCENHDQVIERLGPARQAQSGYDRPVYIYYILADNTIDEDILVRLRERCSMQEALRKAMERREKENAY